MKLQQKLLAALLAVAFTGGAHAAIDDSTTGSGSLYASVSNGSSSSAVFDLGFLIDNFLPAAYSAPGTTLTWNLASSATPSGTVGATNYTTIWADFSATVTNWATVVFDVAAGDNTGAGNGTDRYLSTSIDPLATVANQKNSNLSTFGSATDLYLQSNNQIVGATGNHTTQANGASLSTGGSSLYFNGKGDKWSGKSTWNTTGVVGTSSDFYYVQTSSTSPLGAAGVTRFGWADPSDSNLNGKTFETGTFTLTQSGLLTYNVAAVPEADTWAMFAAGLLVVGAIARRRMQA